jgi:APA family basic amino acid/polyamine antiporter
MQTTVTKRRVSEEASAHAGSFAIANFFRKKPVEKSLSEETTPRTLTWVDITMYGIAATVGSGVYATVGIVAHGQNEAASGGFVDATGPAVLFSTLVAGLLSFLTSICYLEFASALPISGSGYAYFYALIGEFLGWFIGWNLTLEYAFAASVVASRWSDSLLNLVKYSNVFGEWSSWEMLFVMRPFGEGSMIRINITAALLICVMGLVVGRGLSMGTRFTNMATLLNLTLIAFVITYGWRYVEFTNWKPFFPTLEGIQGALPMTTRIFAGAAEMFFCYIGYDTVSTLSADAINPGRDIPIGALLTIGTATALYGLVGLVLTGMCRFETLDKATPLASAFLKKDDLFAYAIVNAGSLISMAVTVFACMLGQPKIFAAISRDGLLPRRLAAENSRGVATGSLWLTIGVSAIAALTMDVDKGLVNMISAGCLLSMAAVCAGMIAARFNNAPEGLKQRGQFGAAAFLVATLAACLCSQHLVAGSWMTLATIVVAVGCFLMLLGLFLRFPDMLSRGTMSPMTAQGFLCPLMPWIPCVAILANCYVMASINLTHMALFVGWAVVGVLIYIGYGLKHSVLGQELEAVRSFGKI